MLRDPIVLSISVAEEEEHAPDNVYGNMPSRGTAVRVEDLKTFLQKHATDSLLREQFQVYHLSIAFQYRIPLPSFRWVCTATPLLDLLLLSLRNSF